MGLRMITCRTGLWRLLSLVKIAAVAAPPDDFGVPLEHSTRLDVCSQVQISLFMLSLRYGDVIENSGDLIESFLSRHLGITGIH